MYVLLSNLVWVIVNGWRSKTTSDVEKFSTVLESKPLFYLLPGKRGKKFVFTESQSSWGLFHVLLGRIVYSKDTVCAHDENFLMKMRCRWNIRKLPSKLVQLCGFFSILLTKRLFSSTFIRKMAQCGQKSWKGDVSAYLVLGQILVGFIDPLSPLCTIVWSCPQQLKKKETAKLQFACFISRQNCVLLLIKTDRYYF